MKRYSYQARDSSGARVSGEVEANDEQAAAKLIHNKGLLLTSLTASKSGIWRSLEKFRDRINLDDIAILTRQLSTMVSAGLSITEALLILRYQTKGSLQQVVTQILADVEGGESLSTALSKHAKFFPPSYIALVKAGEASGVIDTVLTRLADNLERQQEFRGKVKGALIYPVIIVVGMIAVGVAMMLFVIPRLTSLYSDFNAKLPLPTQILIFISSFLAKFWPVLLFLGLLAVWGVMSYRKTKLGRENLDRLMLTIPIVGELQREIILAELTRTLGLMIGTGVPILESLSITAGVVDNSVISGALREAAKMVEKGFPIAYSFAKFPETFPFLLSQMLSVGEETGKLDEVLAKVSHIFEVESDQKVKALTTAIEPLVMVTLGVGVGFLVIAIILPIYNLTSSF